jgi:hypothetical protein
VCGCAEEPRLEAALSGALAFAAGAGLATIPVRLRPGLDLPLPPTPPQGNAFPGLYGMGAVHKSPEGASEESPRLLLTVDDVTEPCACCAA